eukprot:4343801-Pleurochrysis_carterae.AAC.7
MPQRVGGFEAALLARTTCDAVVGSSEEHILRAKDADDEMMTRPTRSMPVAESFPHPCTHSL